MRSFLNRNEHGQYADEKYHIIDDYVKAMIHEYVKEFKDVDIDDLFLILIREGSYQLTLQKLREAEA